ncbi:MAG TPA: Asp-tRNA(Asn)/Glu-tRNA(Gln) amidotransferase GatCAB subunit B, partial [Ktedonobacterales bacterium]
VSVRPRGQQEFGVKTEIKNMNSFKAVERALTYEAQRQIEELEAGRKIIQSTRGWIEDKGITVLQRVKENSDDYRYFPEPDLPPLEVSRAWVARLQARLPELPDAARERFERDYGLSTYDAEQLTAERALADYFEAAVKAGAASDTHARAKAVANWALGDLRRLLNAANLDVSASKLTPAGLAELLDMIGAGTISGKQAKDVLEKAFASGASPKAVVASEGISQLSDTGELESIVDAVIAENPKAVEDFRAGKASAVQFLMGQVMKRTKGRARPDVVTPLLQSRLSQA